MSMPLRLPHKATSTANAICINLGCVAKPQKKNGSHAGLRVWVCQPPPWKNNIRARQRSTAAMGNRRGSTLKSIDSTQAGSGDPKTFWMWLINKLHLGGTALEKRRGWYAETVVDSVYCLAANVWKPQDSRVVFFASDWSYWVPLGGSRKPGINQGSSF